jgi:hypothetical protein
LNYLTYLPVRMAPAVGKSAARLPEIQQDGNHPGDRGGKPGTCQIYSWREGEEGKHPSERKTVAKTLDVVRTPERVVAVFYGLCAGS